jgi:hypothetical protein
VVPGTSRPWPGTRRSGRLSARRSIVSTPAGPGPNASSPGASCPATSRSRRGS